MRNRGRGNSNVERLRLAIDCMPVATREAMLAGVRANERIIVGAYVDGRGGVCPMLAAHRAGARTDFLSFARSWDRFTRAKGGVRVASTTPMTARTTRTNPATQRVVWRRLPRALTLRGRRFRSPRRCRLELDEAIKEHRRLVSRGRRARMRRPRLPDAADPTGEIVARRLRGTSLGRFLGDHPSQRTGQRSLSPAPARV